jgi:hypothetical protein
MDRFHSEGPFFNIKNEAPTETPPGLKPWWGASNLTNLPTSSASAFSIITFSLLKEEWFNGRKNADTKH